jgi:hypothetical protein
MEQIVRIDSPVGGQHPAGLKLARSSIDKPSDRSNNGGVTTDINRFRLEHNGQFLDLSARRDGLRTHVALFMDGDQVAEASGLGRIMTPLSVATSVAASTLGPNAGPAEIGSEPQRSTVLALSVLPGTVSRALLLVPRPDSADAGLGSLVSAERHPFVPPPGSFAARMLIFQRNHPRLYASRRVVLAVGQVVAALLGLAVFVRLLLQPVVDWIRDRLPQIDLPSIPWPSIPWPDIPLPDIDLPELALPVWLRVIIGTARFWLPVLIAISVAVAEVRRRRAKAERAGDRDAHR